MPSWRAPNARATGRSVVDGAEIDMPLHGHVVARRAEGAEHGRRQAQPGRDWGWSNYPQPSKSILIRDGHAASAAYNNLGRPSCGAKPAKPLSSRSRPARENSTYCPLLRDSGTTKALTATKSTPDLPADSIPSQSGGDYIQLDNSTTLGNAKRAGTSPDQMSGYQNVATLTPD